MKSSITGALACLVYHAANGVRLAVSGRHLRPITGAIIVGTPFLFGGLLLLENPSLLQSLSGAFLSGDWQAWAAGREALGRVMVLLLFNELAANAISLATKGTWLRTFKAHGFLALVSVGVVASPSVADWGSGASVAALPASLRALASILSAMASQAGLWVEAYFITGMILDGVHGYAPTGDALVRHGSTGLRKGLAYSGLFMGFLYGIKGVLEVPWARAGLSGSPLLSGVLAGALLFPLLKTIIESFDGSMPFFLRLRYSYAQVPLYLRGAVAGAGFGIGLGNDFIHSSSGDRATYGFLVGLLASAGVSFFRDAANALRRKGRVQPVKTYLVDAAIGGCIGALGAFYLDGAQAPVLIEKFRAYTSAGLETANYTIYSLVSKWGRVDLGSYAGGVRLFFDEALAGLITWSIAAPLFAVNRVFMTAAFQRDKAPIRHFFSRAGAVELGVNLIHVMRWGLWMSPIINTGLRMMGQATWYNQDGAVRTLVAAFKSLTLSPGDFQAWSLAVFVSLLAYDFLRV
jgi:cyclic beta-1,2-glucan synthetase